MLDQILNMTPQKRIQGIPWAFDNPEAHLIQWKAKLASFIGQNQWRQEQFESELRKVDLLPSTRARLEKLATAYREQQELVRNLMPDFAPDSDLLAIMKIIEDRVPSRQHIDTYTNNIFRDWVWGEEEIKLTLAALKPHFESNISEKILLTVGAGACRIPLELHLKFCPRFSVALDINPFLLLTAQKLFNGESIELFEFPYPPLEEVARKHVIQTPLRRPENFELLFGDGLNLPFKPKSIDMICTPWFIDIVPMDLAELAERLNFILKPGGTWVNFGPLSFASPHPSRNYTTQEIPSVLAKAGFSTQQATSLELPYLQSPFSAQKRIETVFFFQATKVKDAKQRPKYRFLPEHLSDLDLPFPLLPDTQQRLAQSQTTAELLSLIDGKKSLNDMADLISRHSQIEKNKVIENLLTFFINLYERNF